MGSIRTRLTALLLLAALMLGFMAPAAAADASPLTGRTILFFGDSLTSGRGLANPSESWPSMLAASYDMDLLSAATAGSTVATADKHAYEDGGCCEPMVERVSALPDTNVDIIFFQGGCNDWNLEIPLGKVTDTNPKTFAGALQTTLAALRKKYPSAQLVCMTPWVSVGRLNDSGLNLNTYSQLMADVCARWNIPCYRADDSAASEIYMDRSSFRESYCLTKDDSWHLNAAGQQLFLPKIAAWLNSVVPMERPATVAGFQDVLEGSWYASSVEFVHALDLMNGVTKITFQPEGNLTRAMLTTILYRLYGTPETNTLSTFADVPAGSYYAKAVAWAQDHSIVAGMDETHFCPDALVTREQAVTMLQRFATVCFKTTYASSASSELLEYEDRGSISPYAEYAMRWSVRVGLITGTGTGSTLDPQGAVTRAQVATILIRYIPHVIQAA